MKTSYRLIATRSELESFAKSLEQTTAVAVDLEADSMYHFQEKVCLIQMATDSESIVIDPIQSQDLSPLKPLFSNPQIKKIIHGADYDVRSLYRDFKIEINHLFDTQIACTFLGFKETGLDAVLKQKFDVHLDKKYQRKDWSIRPLSEKMMAYAVMDVIYLIPLAKMLEKALKKLGRLDWVYEESEIISKVRAASDDNQPLYLKFRGAGRLKRRNLAALEALLQFRMRTAQQKDRPLFKVIANSAVMKIAQALPRDLPSLKKTDALSPQQVKMYGQAVTAAVNNALKMPVKRLPIYPKKPAPPVAASLPRRVKALKSWRDSKSQALKIDPGILCSNALISTVAVKNPLDIQTLEKIEELKSWQKRELGPEMITVLRKVK